MEKYEYTTLLINKKNYGNDYNDMNNSNINNSDMNNYEMNNSNMNNSDMNNYEMNNSEMNNSNMNNSKMNNSNMNNSDMNNSDMNNSDMNNSDMNNSEMNNSNMNNSEMNNSDMNNSDMNNLEPCSICYEDIEENKKKILICNHIFHKKCINDWMKIKPICPYCRKYIINSFVCSLKQKFISKKCKIFLDEEKFSKIIIKFYIPIINKFYKELIIPTNFIKYIKSINNLVFMYFRKNDTAEIERFTFEFSNENESYHFCEAMKHIFQQFYLFYQPE
jgi:hypothetical protein